MSGHALPYRFWDDSPDSLPVVDRDSSAPAIGPSGPGAVARAREAREVSKQVARLAPELRAVLSRHPASAAAAAELWRRARAQFERERHRDPHAWVRDLSALRRLVEVVKEIESLLDHRGRALTGEQRDVLAVLEKKRDVLCKPLGYDYPGPGLADMIAIAEAVGAGAEPDPNRAPADWPRGRPWLQARRWDADMQLLRVVRETLDVGPHLLLGEEQTRLRLGWCIALALDTDRSVVEEVLRLAGTRVPEKLGPQVRKIRDMIPENCSPIRFLLALDIFGDNDPRDHALVRGRARADGLGGDLASAARLLDQTRLDSGLLELAEELLADLESNADPALDTKSKVWAFILHNGACEIGPVGATTPFRLKKGHDYIHKLLMVPHKPVPAADLAGAVKSSDKKHPTMDESALDEARQRASDLKEEVEEAKERGDEELHDRRLAELSTIAKQLSADTDHRGRPRALDPERDNTRSAVGHAIRSVLGELDERLPEIGRHLRAAIPHPASEAPVYKPAHEVRWRLS